MWCLEYRYAPPAHASTTAAVTPTARPTVVLAKEGFVPLATVGSHHVTVCRTRQRLTPCQ